VRSRSSIPKLRIVIGLAVALCVAVVVALSVNRYRGPEAAPPEALAHIAQKNHDAAVVAAAHQRVESAVSTTAAEDLAEARRRAGAEANASLTRSNVENRVD
jgi:negative regulator of sigma E activity